MSWWGRQPCPLMTWPVSWGSGLCTGATCPLGSVTGSLAVKLEGGDGKSEGAPLNLLVLPSGLTEPPLH